MIYAVDILRGEARTIKRRLEERHVQYEQALDRKNREEKDMRRLVGLMNDLSQDLAEIERAIAALGSES